MISGKPQFKKKQLYSELLVFLAFLIMVAGDLTHFRQGSDYHRTASAKFAAVLFLVPPSQPF
jgi:hypothetical protein